MNFTRRTFLGTLAAMLGVAKTLPASEVIPPKRTLKAVWTSDITQDAAYYHGEPLKLNVHYHIEKADEPGFLGSQKHKEWEQRMESHYGKDWKETETNVLLHPETQKPAPGYENGWMVFYLDVKES